MGQKRSVWVLLGQNLNNKSCPKIRAVYFSKRDSLRRIEWLERSGSGHKHKYWIEKIPFIEDTRREDD